MLQVIDMIQSYKLKFHPVSHGITVSCERYTLGFPVCYKSPSDVFAASSGFAHLNTLCFKEKKKKTERKQYVNKEWTYIKNVILEAAKEEIGEQRKERNQDW
jgi:hypothetical protein